MTRQIRKKSGTGIYHVLRYALSFGAGVRQSLCSAFLGWEAYQYPNIAAGVIPKVAQSKRAIFSVGSALPET